MPESTQNLDPNALAQRLAVLSPDKHALFEKALEKEGIDPWALPIVPAEKGGIQEFPLSFAQERLWSLHRLDPANPQYNLFSAVAFRGVLNADVLVRVIQTLTARHEILRTRFVEERGSVVQVIDLAVDIDLSQVEVRAADEAGRQAAVETQAQEERVKPFDLSRTPLFRVKLLRMGRDTHVLLLTVHHILADAWSMAIIVNEIATLYRAYVQGQSANLPDLPIQYADFAQWQRRWLSGRVYQKQLNFWRKRLENVSPLLDLPSDRPRLDRTGSKGRVIRLTLGAALSAEIRAACREQGVTAYIYFLAAWQLLLHRLSGQDDICVGSSIANRPRPETEVLIGFFVNTLVMRADFSRNPSVYALLQQVRAYVLGAIEHQDLPFEKLVEALQPDRVGSHHPLFQVLFVMQNAPSPSLLLPGLDLRRLDLPQRFARFDLSLRIAEPKEEDGFSAALEYHADLFECGTAESLLHQYQTLLLEMTHMPSRKISELPLLRHAERDRLRKSSSVILPPDDSLPARWSTQVRRYPERVALEAGGQDLTYLEIDQRSDALAQALTAQGIGLESPVGVFADRGVTFVLAMLAVIKSGGYFVPLDRDWPQTRLLALIDDAGISMVLCADKVHQERIPTGIESLDCTAWLTGSWQQVPPGDRSPVCPDYFPQHLAYCIYTSGSSGQPKGVAVSHGSLVAYVDAFLERLRLPKTARMAWVSGPAADLGFTSVWGALLSGRTLVILDKEQALDAEDWRKALCMPADMIKIAPSHFKALWTQADDPAALLPSHFLVFGGESPDRDWVKAIRAIAPGLKIVNHYGPTETTVGVAMQTLVEADSNPPIGVPFSHVEAWVMDRYAQPLPDGMSGELYLGGACLARGYSGRAGLTAERFVPHPCLPGERLYRSGDRVRRSNGVLYFLGRVDQQLSLHGFRVEPAEVEQCLRQLPGVSDGAVAVVQREDSMQLGAYLIAEKAGNALDMGRLRDVCMTRLPTYMVPDLWVELSALPLTANGKVDRKRLALCPPRHALMPTADTPKGDAECKLAEIWASVLKRQSIGRHDDFFALGGDSILGLQVVARARRTGLVITPKQLFTHPNLSALAASAQTPGGKVQKRGPVAGDVKLTPIQHWFFDQALSKAAHWNQALLLGVNTRLSCETLREAAVALAAHHDALRLRFVNHGGVWRQYYADEISCTVYAEDLKNLNAGEQSVRITSCCATLQSSFDLENGPLWVLAYFDLGEKKSGRLFFAAHHLIVDGVSWRILLEDLEALYHHRPLNPKSASYQDWAQRLSVYAQSDAVSSQLPFWLSQPPVRDLLRDLKGDNTYASGAEVTMSLDRRETDHLLGCNTGPEPVDVDDLLLTALAAACTAWCSTDSVTIEYESHGREMPFDAIGDDSNEIDVSQTVGWFTARYPLHLRIDCLIDPYAQLRSVSAQRRAIPGKGLGYGLIRYLSPYARRLQNLGDPQISYNNLGQVDKGIEAGLWSKAGEHSGAQRDPQSVRPRLLMVNARINDDRLAIYFLYSRAVHRRETIEMLANDCIEQLRALIDACHRLQAHQSSLQFDADVVLDAGDVAGLLREMDVD